MADLLALEDIVGAGHVLTGDAISDDYTHDEALTATPQVPLAVVRPGRHRPGGRGRRAGRRRTRCPLTARGSGTGLSGACIPRADGILVSFERMAEILEIDDANHVAVVQPGVTLHQLDEALKPHGLVYPVFPGESSASLGGNVATNAGGMRAVRYGVTRHQVLGLTAVLGTGEVLQHRRQVREGHLGLRPHAADHRLRGHARPRHRGDPAAAPAPHARRHHAHPVRHHGGRHRRRSRRSSAPGSCPRSSSTSTSSRCRR